MDRKRGRLRGSGRALLFVGLGLPVGCAGSLPQLQIGGDPPPEVQATVAQVVRAGDAVFRAQGIPVEVADELGGWVRSGSFSPWDRWGPAATDRVSCGWDVAGEAVIATRREAELEIRVEARRVPGTLGTGPAGDRTHLWVTGTGSVQVDGEERPCSLAPAFARALTDAIVERVSRRPGLF